MHNVDRRPAGKFSDSLAPGIIARCMQHAPSNDSHFISFRNWISRRSIGLRAAPLYSVFSSIRWKTIAFDLPSEQKSWHLRMDQIACSAIVGVVKIPQYQGGVPHFGHPASSG